MYNAVLLARGLPTGNSLDRESEVVVPHSPLHRLSGFSCVHNSDHYTYTGFIQFAISERVDAGKRPGGAERRRRGGGGGVEGGNSMNKSVAAAGSLLSSHLTAATVLAFATSASTSPRGVGDSETSVSSILHCSCIFFFFFIRFNYNYYFFNQLRSVDFSPGGGRVMLRI